MLLPDTKGGQNYFARKKCCDLNIAWIQILLLRYLEKAGCLLNHIVRAVPLHWVVFLWCASGEQETPIFRWKQNLRCTFTNQNVISTLSIFWHLRQFTYWSRNVIVLHEERHLSSTEFQLDFLLCIESPSREMYCNRLIKFIT